MTNLGKNHLSATTDVDTVTKQTLFQGYFKIDRYHLKHRLFEGGWSPELVREVFERGHAVSVLLFDPIRDQVVLIEQFRPGAFAALASPWFDNNTSPWLIETVAGIIEDGETPQSVAMRESIEEAGCQILDIEPICHYLVSPGGTSESMFIFCGRVDATHAEGIHGLADEGENIRVFTVSCEQAFEWLEQGKINNSMTIIALQWLKLNHEKIRSKWLNSMS